MKFTKMQGIGNDFIMVNAAQEEKNLHHLPELAKAVCDRHFGIGGDGLILCIPHPEADFEMRIFNSDGSEAEMCGNGIRCAALFAKAQGLVQTNHCTVHTKAGLMKPEIISDAVGKQLVKVDMGMPHLAGPEIPCVLKGDTILEQPIEIQEKDYLFSAVSMGNPHCVVFLTQPVKDFPVQEIGPHFEHHPYFPAKTNVEFVEVLDEHQVNMRVWERGCGETLACGTGACATAVASILTKRCQDQVQVHLLGGTLSISYQPGGHVWMEGPAQTVFTGEFPW